MTEISRETIKTELKINDVTTNHGTTGIAWVYQQLGVITKNENYLNEAHYWHNLTFNMKEVDKGFVGFDLKAENNAFGLLQGLAGIGLYNSTILQFDKNLVKMCCV